MTSKWIDIQAYNGNTFSGYLALPPTGKGPGIVLVQEIWGVNHHIRQVAEQYALDGYVVLAPDVFWRLEPRVDLDYAQAGTQRAMSLLQSLDFAQAGTDVASAVDCLRSLPEVTGKIAVIGYCMGGQLAYRAAATGKPDAAVCYYGGGIQQNLELAEQIKQPILFHYAGQDQLIPAQAVADVKAALSGNSDARFFDYPDANHGFNCWGRPMYDQKAAALARGRTLRFLSENL